MSDPQRLLSPTSDAEDFERELLASIQRIEPPRGAKGQAWSKLAAEIAAVSLVTTAHASAAASGLAAPGASAGAGATLAAAPAALSGLAGKLVLGLSVAGLAVGGSALWLNARTPQPPPAPLTAPRLSAASTLPTPPVEHEPSAATPAEVSSLPSARLEVAPVRRALEMSAEAQLSAESALLTQVRAELRRGDAASAQQTLDRLLRKFPKGVLGQEREVLGIQVLAARGNSEAARRRARAFMAAYPKSPHSAQLARFADAP